MIDLGICPYDIRNRIYRVVYKQNIKVKDEYKKLFIDYISSHLLCTNHSDHDCLLIITNF